MKKNTITVSKRQMGKIIAESIKKVLNEFYDDSPVYGIGTLIYKKETNEISDYEGLDTDGSDDFDSVQDAVETIKYMCSYPKGSVEWDIRYANGWVPAFYVYDKETMRGVDNKLYMSSIDAKYRKIFSKFDNANVICI